MKCNYDKHFRVARRFITNENCPSDLRTGRTGPFCRPLRVGIKAWNGWACVCICIENGKFPRENRHTTNVVEGKGR